jgi:hypothetical protein
MLVAHLRAIEEQTKWLHFFTHVPPSMVGNERDKWVHKVNLATLAEGDTFFISGDVLKTVNQCAENIPSETTWEPRWMPTQKGWMWLDEFVPARFEPEGDGFLFSVGWWELEPDQYMILLFGMTNMGITITRLWYTPIPGETISELMNNTEVGNKKFVPWAYSLFYVMSQPVMTNVVVQKTSPLVRSMASRKGTKIRPDVRIVTLRRLAQHQGGGASGHRDIDWSCRWVVGADFKHWRKQFYPSTGEHKYIHIPPFVKGPADKPMKQPTKTLFQVTR